MPRILVAGATGIVGGAAVEHFAGRSGWEVLALSRRAPSLREGVHHVALDLMDAAACHAGAAQLQGVTHLLYAALYEKPNLVAGWRERDQMEVNLAMLRNLLDALEASGPALRHITILQGTKAYGLHHTQVPVPAKERWPRAPHEVFYWLQEDLLRERQPRSGWTFTVLRPQLILGHAVGSPMNVIAAIGVYAATLRELGEPLRFPGGGRYVHAASDSRLIAQAAEFAGTHEAAANQTYNVVNGDMLVWQDVWPAIAAHFGMAVGEPRPMRLAEEMPAHEGAWRRVVQRHGLRDVPWDRLLGSSWQFTDRTFGYGLEHPLDRIESPIKLWQAGFTGCQDTEDAIVHWLSRMQRERLLPT
ncbi:MAG TPA: SDR family oxidoreductase [Ramlibacter sp.]|nr:SDR family oxidoreductase [Ramlibacter sp.]